MQDTEIKQDNQPYVDVDKIRQAIHERDLHEREVASLLKIRPESLSRMWKKQERILDRLPDLCKILKMTREEFLTQSDPANLSTEQPALKNFFRQHRPGSYIVTEGSEVIKVKTRGVQVWYLCAPKSRKPRHDEVVVVREEGKHPTLYRFSPDQNDSGRVVLQPLEDNIKGVLVVELAKQPMEILVAVGPLVIEGT